MTEKYQQGQYVLEFQRTRRRGEYQQMTLDELNNERSVIDAVTADKLDKDKPLAGENPPPTAFDDRDTKKYDVQAAASVSRIATTTVKVNRQVDSRIAKLVEALCMCDRIVVTTSRVVAGAVFIYMKIDGLTIVTGLATVLARGSVGTRNDYTLREEWKSGEEEPEVVLTCSLECVDRLAQLVQADALFGSLSR